MSQRSPETEPLPAGDPQELGFIPERLNKIGNLLDAEFETGKLHGAVTLVVRQGKVAHAHTCGKLDMERPAPVATDSLFRLYSQTKPMTAAVLMTLFEDGAFLLDEPVSKWIPEFARPEVYTFLPAQDAVRGNPVPTVPARREITIFDLLTMTSGLPSLGRTPIAYWPVLKPAWEGTGMSPEDTRFNDPTLDYDDLVTTIAATPLHSHPGELWNYGSDYDVLTLFLTRVSGMDLETLFQEKLLGPLGMNDSSFYCDEADVGRLVTEHRWNPTAETLMVRDRPETTEKVGRGTRRLMSGNGTFGGLLSSPRDFSRFAQMLANDGELDGVRVLGRKTVELMRSNHLGDRNISVFGPNYGFGFGGFVRKSVEGTFIPGSAGTYGWAGAAGTWFFVDPKEELIGMFFTQVFGFQRPTGVLFEKMTYEALA
jgi:CubicO group peptidase (beta-lactamase class C family)